MSDYIASFKKPTCVDDVIGGITKGAGILGGEISKNAWSEDAHKPYWEVLRGEKPDERVLFQIKPYRASKNTIRAEGSTGKNDYRSYRLSEVSDELDVQEIASAVEDLQGKLSPAP